VATVLEKAKLLQGLMLGDVARVGPFYVDIDVTNRCNLHCLGCVYHSPHVSKSAGDTGHIQMALVTDLFADLEAMGTSAIILQGAGEPLLNPELPQIISLAKRAGLRVTVLTNGTLLSRARIEELIEARLDVLKVSLWAVTSEQYEQNHPGTDPRNLARVIDSLKLASEIKAERRCGWPSLFVHHPINRLNHETLDRVVEIAVATGCSGVTFSPWSTVRGVVDSFALSAEQQRRVCAALVRLKKKLGELRLQHNIDQALLRYRAGGAVWEKLPCYVAWIHARIRIDGTIQPCGRCDMSLGSLRESRFRQAWNGAALRAFRRQVRTRAGLAAMGNRCDCTYCCYLPDNLRVHRLFRWVAPLALRD
jgi:MoaA/NifB/PqqE/SkfB family radical SAM enzyme